MISGNDDFQKWSQGIADSSEKYLNSEHTRKNYLCFLFFDSYNDYIVSRLFYQPWTIFV